LIWFIIINYFGVEIKFFFLILKLNDDRIEFLIIHVLYMWPVIAQLVDSHVAHLVSLYRDFYFCIRIRIIFSTIVVWKIIWPVVLTCEKTLLWYPFVLTIVWLNMYFGLMRKNLNALPVCSKVVPNSCTACLN
jgi:hypothetical protein